MARSFIPRPTRLLPTLLALSTLAVSGGCAAYSKAMGTVLQHTDNIAGSFEAVNTMSVPVCKITVSPSGGEVRDEDELRGDVLSPGQTARVDIPLMGDPMDVEAPQPESWDVAVYGCDAGPIDTLEPSDTVLVAFDGTSLENDGSLTIR